MNSNSYYLSISEFPLWCSFSVHAIHMGEDVLSVFEHAIKVLSRREDLVDSRYDFLEYTSFPFSPSTNLDDISSVL